MVTIYDLANLVLSDIMNIYYESGQDFDNVIKYLNGDSTQFDNIFDSYGELSQINRDSVKKVIMLNIFSYAYLVNLYNFSIDLDSDSCEKYLSVLESLNPQEIFDMFASFSPEVKIFYEDASEYLTNTYIFRYCCWENLFREGHKKTLFKINPFAILEYKDTKLEDGFIETEVYIQLFDDLYNKAVEQASIDPELLDEDDADRFDQLVIEHFLSIVDKHFNSDSTQIEYFFSTIFSNIYENITLNVKTNKKQRKKYSSLIAKFEEYSINDLIIMFMENYSFAIDVIDIFLTYNSYLEKGELINRRISFLKKGNAEKLAELNPFYNNDIKVLERHKEKGSI